MLHVLILCKYYTSLLSVCFHALWWFVEVFLEPLLIFLSLFESVFFVYTFRGLFYLRYSSSRCTHCLHFHFISLFTFVILLNSIEKGHICRPQKAVFFFSILLFYCFLI